MGTNVRNQQVAIGRRGRVARMQFLVDEESGEGSEDAHDADAATGGCSAGGGGSAARWGCERVVVGDASGVGLFHKTSAGQAVSS